MHELLGRIYTDGQWEGLCSRCGACCFESRWTDTGWEQTDVPCTYLDGSTKECNAYGQRFEVEQDCIRVTPSVVLSGILPSECSYNDELHRIAEEEWEGDAPRSDRGRRGSRRRRQR